MANEFQYWRDVVEKAPAEWRRLPLKNVFRERKERGREDLPLLSVTGDRGIILRDELDRRDTSSANKSKYLRVAPGDLAYNTMRMWQGVSGVSSCEGIVSPAYTVCELRDSHHSDFMGYLCKLPLLVGRFHAYSQGIVSDTLSLRFRQFGEIVAPTPPALEQRKIAAILSSVDGAITATRRVIEQTRRVKQGLLQKLMTRGIGHTRFKKTEIGEIPEAWEVQPLPDLGADDRPMLKAGPFGSSLKKNFYTEAGYKIYGQEQVLAGDASFGDYYIDEERYRTLESCSVRPGDVLVSLVGTPGKTLVLPDDAEPGIINPRLVRLSPSLSLVDPHYLSLWLCSARVRKKLASLSQGGTMDVLNSKMLSSLRMALPPIEEQKAIVHRIHQVERALAELVASVDRLRCLKRGLMQDLLTGRVRVQPD